METREELLKNLYEARDIIQRAENITQRYNDTKSRLLNRQVFVQVQDRTGTKIKNTAVDIIAIIVLGILGFFTFLSIIGALIMKDSMMWIEIFVWTAIYAATVLFVVYRRTKRKERYAEMNRQGQMAANAENERRAQFNAQIEKEVELINAEMQEIQQIADERLFWYPRSYCYSDAVMFLISAIQDFRADSLKEAVNLYAEELKHRQVLENQQHMLSKQEESIRQQRFNNVLSAMNLFATLSVKDAVNNNTAAVNANTDAINVYNNYRRVW